MNRNEWEVEQYQDNKAEVGENTPLQPKVAAVAASTFEDPKEYIQAPFLRKSHGEDSVSLNNGALHYQEADFTLPGRNGFDLVIARRYDSDASNNLHMNPKYVRNQSKPDTYGVANTHLRRMYGLGYGWSFMLPSIESVEETLQNTNIGYKLFAHLSDGRSMRINGGSWHQDSYTLEDVRLVRQTGKLTHPYHAGEWDYYYSIHYKTGEIDFFDQLWTGSGRSKTRDCYKLVGRRDRFGNTITFDIYDYSGMRIIDTWGREIFLRKSGNQLTWSLPNNQSVVYTVDNDALSEVKNLNGDTTKYSYSSRAAQSRCTDSDDGIYISYRLLSTVTYPTGAETKFTYGNKTEGEYLHIKLNSQGGYQRTFPLLTREDIVDEKRCNLTSYTYSLPTNTNKQYISQTVMTKGEIEEVYGFNAKSLCTSQIIRSSGTKISEATYGYNDDKLMISETQKLFSRTNQDMFSQKTTIYTYYKDKKANVETIEEKYKDNPGLDQTTSFEYHDTCSMLTYKSYQKDAGTLIEEKYTLKNGKLVEAEEIWEGNVKRQRSEYVYGEDSSLYSYNNLVKEHRYYGANMEKAQSTNYEYTSDRTARPTKRTVGAVEYNISYDSWGRVSTQTDGKNTTSFQYDGLGRVKEECYANGSKKQFAYNTVENHITTTDEDGKRQRVYYTPLGMVRTEGYLDEGTGAFVPLKSFAYDTLERLAAETVYNANGTARNTTRYTYDNRDRVTEKSVYRASSSAQGDLLSKETVEYLDVTTTTRSRQNKTIQEDGYADSISSYAIADQKGQVIEEGVVTDVGNSVNYYSYDKLGNRVKTTAPNGYVTEEAYDYAGRVVRQYLPYAGSARPNNQAYAETTYDALGNKTLFKDFKTAAGDWSVSYEYDELNRLITQTSRVDGSSNAVTQYQYDNAGNVTQQKVQATSELWRVTEHKYDVRNRVVETKQYLNANGTDYVCAKYIYDGRGNKTRVTTGVTPAQAGVSTNYAYDQLGNVIRMTDALNQSESYIYDKTGLLTQKTDRKGQLIKYAYDAMARVSSQQVTEPKGVTALHCTYTVTGQKAQEWNLEQGKEVVRTTYYYNKAGLLRQQVEVSAAGTVTKNYAYDLCGNRVRFTVSGPSDVDMQYKYDGQNRLIQVSRGTDRLATYTYDLNGNRDTLEGKAGTTKYTYNRANLVTAIDSPMVAYRYTYRLDGNQTAKTEDGKTTTYEYDRLGRLTRETAHEGIYTYAYDNMGNRKTLTATVTGGDNYTVGYQYDKNNRLTLEEKKSGNDLEQSRYTYDANGNQLTCWKVALTPKDMAKYGVVGFGDQVDLGEASHKLKDVATVTHMEYNGFDQMVLSYKKGEHVIYQYRPDGLRHSKNSYNRKTDKTVYHLWDGDQIIADYGDFHARYLRGVNLLAREQDGQLQYYHHNAHGDVTVRTMVQNKTETPLKRYRYDAFGVEWDPVKEDQNPFRYCGEYLDLETDTIYLRARQYDPSTGRFCGEDIIRDGFNWYTYCGNKPVALSDPSGLAPTTKEAAAMNDHIYNPYGQKHRIWPKVNLIGGWEFENYADLAYDQGFVAGVYSRTIDGETEYALVSKGTDPVTLRDWGQNVNQVFGNSSDVWDYMIYAENFVEEHAGCEVTFVGHSKGGAEAAAGAMYTNNNGIIFNPATLNFTAYGLSAENYSGNIRTYIVHNEPLYQALSYTQIPTYSQLGSIYVLPDPYPDKKYDGGLSKTINSLDRHSMWGVRKALGDDTGYKLRPSRSAQDLVRYSRPGIRPMVPSVR